ncbi:MAG TPA: hypothetical protein VFB28_10525 [Terriglobales bacterium]|nr:hypothetical protein [Terriglobales bacterium]
MTKKLGVLTGVLMLMLSIAIGIGAAQNNDKQMDQTADKIAQQQAGHEPHMAAALEHLRQAADELEKATPNKGGHREKALQLTRQAMTQVEQGIQYYNQHPPKK